MALVIFVYFLYLPLSGQIKKEIEPNDRREQAQEIRLGEKIEAGIQENNDEDWFKLVVDKSGKNYLRVEVSGVPGIDISVYIYNSSGERLTEIDDAPKNEPESVNYFVVEPAS